MYILKIIIFKEMSGIQSMIKRAIQARDGDFGQVNYRHTAIIFNGTESCPKPNSYWNKSPDI